MALMNIFIKNWLMDGGLEKLHLVHARLLYIIAELYKEGQINDDQRLALKQLVF